MFTTTACRGDIPSPDRLRLPLGGKVPTSSVLSVYRCDDRATHDSQPRFPFLWRCKGVRVARTKAQLEDLVLCRAMRLSAVIALVESERLVVQIRVCVRMWPMSLVPLEPGPPGPAPAPGTATTANGLCHKPAGQLAL